MHAVNARSYVFFRHLPCLNQLVHKLLRGDSIVAVVWHVTAFCCHEKLVSRNTVGITARVSKFAINLVIQRFQHRTH